jgi:hypothetical protein
MKYYFSLQYKMLNRQLTELGINPILGFVLAAVLFGGLSFFLFLKTEYAPYVYVFFGISSVIKLGETNRNDFLKSCFPKKEYIQLRAIENILIAAPFIIFLLFQLNWIFAIALLFIASILSVFNFNQQLSYTIPTPFYRYPFEFVVGFRKTFFMFFLVVFLTYMSIHVGNFNLGLFGLGLVLLTALSYYAEPEDRHFVWIYNTTPKAFLFKKIQVAIIHATILCLPFSILLAIFFPNDILMILALQCVGYLCLITILLAKYSAYPSKIGVPQGLMLFISVWFPPALLGVIPYLYKKSIERLSNTL